MNAIDPSRFVAGYRADPYASAATLRPLPACDCVVTLTDADEPWTELCRTLRRPAFLLAERDQPTSE